MKFGPVPIDAAAGGIAVHSIRKGGVVLKKGTHQSGRDRCAARRVSTPWWWRGSKPAT
jgi:hypothetical protein